MSGSPTVCTDDDVWGSGLGLRVKAVCHHIAGSDQPMACLPTEPASSPSSSHSSYARLSSGTYLWVERRAVKPYGMPWQQIPTEQQRARSVEAL